MRCSVLPARLSARQREYYTIDNSLKIRAPKPIILSDLDGLDSETTYTSTYFYDSFHILHVARLVYLLLRGRKVTRKGWSFLIKTFKTLSLHLDATFFFYLKSLELSHAMYNSCWYTLRPKEAYDLMFIGKRAQYPLEITAGKFFSLSLGLFAIVSFCKINIQYSRNNTSYIYILASL